MRNLLFIGIGVLACLLAGAGCSGQAAIQSTSTPQHPQEAPSPAPTAQSDLAPWQQTLLDEHNALRRQVGVPDVRWSSTLAEYAQTWADDLARRDCTLEHRPQGSAAAQQYGENLAQGTSLTPAGAVALWSAEKTRFDRANDEAARNACNGRCEHYTQLVWRSTQHLGCGHADRCGLWVCNYDPPGNFIGEKPY